jgi:GTPase SAR1 family protein
VEFTHLRELTASTGKLVLLDTAGQNEAGQVHLRPMLQDQLKKASAVLAVMDYTQLKSEADAQVRDDLKTISDIAQDRIYALVNKFDNCDRNGMQESDVKEFVEGLTDGLIQREKVYPVSARFAYLANRARHDCLEDGSLPDIDDARWVEDFYQEAGLRRNRDRIPERIAEGIEDLWEDSKFSHPLKEVIEVAHDKAALIALESALDKLANYTDQLSPVIFALSNSLSIEKQESEKIIIGLKDDLKEIEKLLEKIEIDKNNIVEKFSEKSRKLIENRYSECNELIKILYGSKFICQEVENMMILMNGIRMMAGSGSK